MTTVGPYGKGRVALFPGAALATTIIAYADEKGRLPSEVYRDYLENKFDYQLLFAYRGWKAEEQEAQIKKARGPKQPPGGETRHSF